MNQYIKGNLKKILKNRRLNKMKKIYDDRVQNEFLNVDDHMSGEYEEDIKKYWKNFGVTLNTDYHKWYASRNGLEDPKYIPEDIFYLYIVPTFNKLEFAGAFADKAYYDLLFPEVKKPLTYIKNVNGFYFDDKFNPISKEKALKICSNRSDKLIVKPTIESGGGKGIQLVEGNNISEIQNKLEKIFSIDAKNFIVQDFINQHEMIGQLNSTSVNTIRVFSFLREEGVTILGSHIRTGKINAFQDHFGTIFGINETGNLYDYGIKSHQGRRLYQNDLEMDIEDVYIPNFDKIINIIKAKHSKLAHFRLIAWDFAINYDEEPLLIEFNIKAPGINNHQLIDGPIFREYTDEVLTEVFK